MAFIQDSPGQIMAFMQSIQGQIMANTFKTVKTKFWPWLSVKSFLNLVHCPRFARKRRVPRGQREQQFVMFEKLLLESPGQNMALIVLNVPHSLACKRPSASISSCWCRLCVQREHLENFNFVY
jgi:hypothetical protein